jgi:acyl-CoA synthetase (AMP-forming)/AMP-acid ligase II
VIRDDIGTLTYGRLIAAVDAVGGGLALLGVRPGDRVALAMTPSAPYLVVLLATLLRGCAACPLNTWLTAQELSPYIDRLTPRFLIADPAHAGLADALGVESVVLPESQAEGTMDARLRRLWRPGPTHPLVDERAPALIIGTGGTTGTPKGVVLDHRALWLRANSCAWHGNKLPDDVDLSLSPFFHASIITSPLAAMFVGGTVRVLERFDADRALDAIGEGATSMNGVATMLTRLVRHPRFGSIDRGHVRSVAWGGMASTAEFAQSVLRAFPGARLQSGWGAAELGPVTRILHRDFCEGRVAGIGRPQIGATVRVVGDDGRDLPAGEIGELAVCCPWQAIGYWDLEQETRSTWGPAGVQVGDLGWKDEHGWFHMSGRRNDKIVSGGENVFPLEVENVLARHPSVEDVTVYGARDDYWGERVEAAVVAKADHVVDELELREFARGKLAAYKIPKAVRVVERLPLTANGKPDRRLLAERAGARLSNPA